MTLFTCGGCRTTFYFWRVRSCIYLRSKIRWTCEFWDETVIAFYLFYFHLTPYMLQLTSILFRYRSFAFVYCGADRENLTALPQATPSYPDRCASIVIELWLMLFLWQPYRLNVLTLLHISVRSATFNKSAYSQPILPARILTNVWSIRFESTDVLYCKRAGVTFISTSLCSLVSFL